MVLVHSAFTHSQAEKQNRENRIKNACFSNSHSNIALSNDKRPLFVQIPATSSASLVSTSLPIQCLRLSNFFFCRGIFLNSFLARQLYDVFQEEWHKYQPKLIKIKLPDGSCVVGEPVADYKSKYRSLKAGIILHDTDDKEKTIAQHLRVSAQIFPTRYSEHLGRVECLIYLPFLPL